MTQSGKSLEETVLTCSPKFISNLNLLTLGNLTTIEPTDSPSYKVWRETLSDGNYIWEKQRNDCFQKRITLHEGSRQKNGSQSH